MKMIIPIIKDKLSLILSLTLLSFSFIGCQPPDDFESTVSITQDCGMKDTVTLRYNRELHLYEGRLQDHQGNTKATGVIHFSQITTKSLK